MSPIVIMKTETTTSISPSNAQTPLSAAPPPQTKLNPLPPPSLTLNPSAKTHLKTGMTAMVPTGTAIGTLKVAALTTAGHFLLKESRLKWRAVPVEAVQNYRDENLSF